MNALIILAAILCAATCAFVLRPAKTPRAFFVASIGVAVIALGLYLYMGNPGIPAHPAKPNAESRANMEQEAQFLAALRANPDDAETMIRLAALRMLQDRGADETMRLLDRADTLKPGDTRIKTLRSMIAPPAPGRN